MRFKRLHKPNKAQVLGWGVPFALLVSVGIMGAVRGGETGSDIAWNTNVTQAQQMAKRVRRPLLLQFHIQGCEWCAKMEAETFADPQVLELSRRFICIRVDGEMETALAQQYNVHEYPTTVFADSEGHVLGKMSGFVPPADFSAVQADALRLDKAQGHR